MVAFCCCVCYGDGVIESRIGGVGGEGTWNMSGLDWTGLLSVQKFVRIQYQVVKLKFPFPNGRDEANVECEGGGVWICIEWCICYAPLQLEADMSLPE